LEKMKKLLIILTILPFVVLGQKANSRFDNYPLDDKKTKSQFNLGKLNATDEQTVLDYLQVNLETFANPQNSTLQLTEKKESPGGFHYVFNQVYNGIPVYNAQVKVNLDKNGRIRSLFDNSYIIQSAISGEFPAEAIGTSYLNTIGSLKSVVKEQVYFPGREMIPCLKLTIREEDHSFYEVILNVEGTVVYQQDLNRYFRKMSDSIVSAKVFLPDPLTTAGVTYGGQYSDNGDADIAELNAERVNVTMTVDFANDTFRLTSPFVEIQDFSGPSTTIATSDIADFSFTRNQKQFEDVNCFYHISTFQNYMQSLGFSLVNYKIGVDAHALNGADNSMFSYPKLYFGDGCVDDAEDADVIIHEYGHAISTSAAPGTWNGSERKAMDEGLGDYLATSYSRSINPFNWQNMFTWDGHSSECWDGRTAATTKMYPGGLTGDIHSDGEIWSSTLMQIWESIGRETTDQILLQSWYSHASNITMTDAAYLFLDADSMLNGGANYLISYYWFEQRGILPSLPFFAVVSVLDDVSCNIDCDVSAEVKNMGGISSYTYEWRDSVGNPISQTSKIAVGLCSGTYSVFVTDGAGDTSTAYITINEPPALTGATSNSIDSGSANGTAEVIIAGGVAPYTYSWNDTQSQTTALATGLTYGTYTITATDANGCTYTALVTVDLYQSVVKITDESYMINVFPNPTNGLINIELSSKPALLEVYNFIGQIVISESGKGETATLHFSEKPSGIYMLIVQDTEGVFHRKSFVVQ